MKKNREPAAAQDRFALMAEWTEQMYAGLEKMETALLSDQLTRYHAEASRQLDSLTEQMKPYQGGEMLNQQRRSIGMMCDGFQRMKSGVDSKYKIFLRGCGNAGKSTLLNALLALDKEKGSRTGRLPMTFTIDTYTEEIPADSAEIRYSASDGHTRAQRMSRKDAQKEQDRENSAFEASKKKCDAIIAERTKTVYLESERDDIKYDIYHQNLLRTTIREILWGIEENPFFHNCVLIDTPGLEQDLRFTNVLDDVKDYEVDGIIWVISSDGLAREEVVRAYEKEMEVFKRIYTGGHIIGVVNVFGNGPEQRKGGREWERVKKRAAAKFCDKFKFFEEVVCVNAQLAYEGGQENNAEKLADSNLGELRTRINQMFVDRISEQVLQEKLFKIESFLDNLYRDVDKYRGALERVCADYDDRAVKIEQLGQECREDLRSSLNSLFNRHMSDVRSNIQANLSTLTAMSTGQQPVDNSFLRNQVVKTGELERKAEEIVLRCEESAYQKFKANRSLCIISAFHTQSYALQAFERAVGAFSVKKRTGSLHLDIRLQDFTFTGTLASVLNEVSSGQTGVLSGIFRVGRAILNSFTPLDQRIYDDIYGKLSSWVHAISMDGAVEAYMSQHRKALNDSMALTCGKRSDIQEIVEFEQEFLQKRGKMQWEPVTLQDLIQ